jgi:hypothetical protein
MFDSENKNNIALEVRDGKTAGRYKDCGNLNIGDTHTPGQLHPYGPPLLCSMLGEQSLSCSRQAVQ